jgi:predicted nuclease with TOPRIM domain
MERGELSPRHLHDREVLVQDRQRIRDLEAENERLQDTIGDLAAKNDRLQAENEQIMKDATHHLGQYDQLRAKVFELEIARRLAAVFGGSDAD